jgi:hypothetical protein
MFVFDLFEKKKQDAAAGRFVGGTSQDARVKNALDNAYRAVPAAKSPEEAALGYIDIQNSLNQKQDQALDQQTKTNQQQTQQINDLVNDMRRKEKDFRDLNAQIANMPNVTPQQVARMAQDIEASHDSDKGQPVDVSNVVAKQTTTQPAKTVAAPGPGASVSQLANYQKAKDQGAATAKTPTSTPQATPQPTTSRALGQMASQLATPGRVIKGKNQQAQQTGQSQQTAQQELPPGVVDFAQQKANRGAKIAGIQLVDQPAPEAGQQAVNFKEQAPAGSDPTSIAKYNIEQLSKAYMSDARSVDMEFPTGQNLTLQNTQIHALVDLLSSLSDGANKQALLVNLFSNRNFLIEWMFENILNKPTQATQQPDPGQLELHEGEVIPMTGSPAVPGNVKAYQYALEILKAAFDERVPTDKIDQMKQMLFHDFQARIQRAPDGTYYLNIDGAKTRLPDPRTFPMEEDAWHNGQNAWSSEHDQWAKESQGETQLSAGDPVIVTAPNEFEGKTGEISEFSPSGKFVIVNLYNHGEHSMHLSDVEYNKYADKELDESFGDSPVAGAITRRILMQRLDLLKQYGPELVGAAVDNVADYVGDVEEIGSSDVSGWVSQVERMLKENPPEAFREGWSDKMVAQKTGQPRTPYSVYIKGKKWKDFANDDHARAVMDKLKAKFKADGRDPETVTIAPTDIPEGAGMPGTTIPQKSVIQGYTVFYNPQTQIISVTRRGVDAGAAIEQMRISQPTMLAFRSAVDRMINKIEDEQGVAETALNPLDPKDDYEAKLKALYDLSLNKDIDQAAVLQRRLDLEKEAKAKGLAEVEKEPTTRQELVNRIDKIQRMMTQERNPANLQILRKELEAIKQRYQHLREGAMKDLYTELADKYQELAPKIERHRDSYLAGELYDALEEIAAQHGAIAEFRRIMNGARNRAHMEYDTNPGGFQNWFWFLPFEEQDVAEAKATKTRLDPKCWSGKKIGSPKTKVKGGVRVNNCVPAESANESINYWTKLQNERNTKIASLVGELTESIEKK